jgi:hypothetical protein
MVVAENRLSNFFLIINHDSNICRLLCVETSIVCTYKIYRNKKEKFTTELY